jgi:hypothetical protein
MKKVILTGVHLFILILANGQITGSYSFGSVQVPGNNSSSFSGPLSFVRKNECLTLQNGVSLFMVTDPKGGIFKMNCRAGITDESKSVNIYPNPADTYTIIQSSQFEPGADRFDVYMMDVRGKIVFHESIKAALLRSGLKISTGKLAGGLYLLKISNNNTTQSFKIIKNGTPK